MAVRARKTSATDRSSAGARGAPGAPTARRRTPLTRDRVLREALALVDEAGLEALTMRRLGERLGVEAMSLYGHVDDKDDLVAGIVDLLWEEVERSVGEATDWREWLTSLARRLRRLANDHPNAFGLVAGSSPFVEPMLRTLGAGLETLRAAGFDDQRAAKTLNTVLGYASGYAAMEVSCAGSGFEVGNGDGESPAGGELEDVVEMVQALPRDLSPELVRVVTDCFVCGFDEQFEFGLEALLAGLDR